MPTSTILSLAILKANWETFGRDYLENFVPLVAECIRLSPDEIISIPSLQEQLRSHFGLRIPQSVIHTILRRVRKRGYIHYESHVYKPIPETLAQLDFDNAQQKVVRMHETLLANLIKFCTDKFGILWTEEEAATALQQYLEDNQVHIIRATAYGTVIPAPIHPVKSAKYIVGAFVKYLQDTHAADFNSLETIVQGNMLANAIFLPDVHQAHRKFKNAEVYFDTSFLIFALGHAGRARRDPCVELLQLLYETGADLRCFLHTLDETRGALRACAYMIREGRTKEAYGPSIEYFLSEGISASDIELFAIQLERDLEALRIRIVDKPPYAPEYLIDEAGLSEALKERMGYRNIDALRRDVDSISAVMRLRRGQEFYLIENCRALMVTTNVDLSRVAREFFYKDEGARGVAPCLTDYSMTNALWLKKPLSAPGLPRKRIIADCYAATQPDERLTRRLLREIDKLEAMGTIKNEHVFLLRHSLEAKDALMELTRGEEDAFTHGTVPEILERVRSRVQADLQIELEAARDELRTVRGQEIERMSRITARAQKFADRIAKIVKYGGLMLLVVGTVSTFPWDLPRIDSAPLRYLIALIQGVLLILSIGNLMYGATLEAYIRKFELILSRWIEKKLVTVAEA